MRLLTLAAIAALPSLSIADQPYSTWMSDSFIYRGVSKTRAYAESVLYRGIEMAYNATGNATYASWVQTQVDGVVYDNGSISGYPSTLDSLDDLRLGTVLLDLYLRTNATKYKAAAGLLRAQLDHHPRTASGGFWHRRPTYPNQMWLDGIFMADVFYAQWTSVFDAGNGTAWDDIVLQYALVEQHCHTNASGALLVHGYDESRVAVWADGVTGASPHVWDRALGWYVMALVDVLDWFPAEHAGREKFLGWFEALAAAVVDAQDESGGWWLVMDEPYPGAPGNYIESSGTAMFTYGLLKGVRKGYIGSEYVEPAVKAYEYMVDEFVARNGTNGTLNWEGTVLVGSLSGNGTYEYYISIERDENDLKGVGPFIYASVEYEALSRNGSLAAS